ncbi:unnamed protein product [Timema podura]|uniref:Uncharacterized protein n=1 Tax=Timema podura TaxID=61482 RepID=A0ABN7NCJ6_TIMPD|nr:unnamed protein product [Timema podura]
MAHRSNNSRNLEYNQDSAEYLLPQYMFNGAQEYNNRLCGCTDRLSLNKCCHSSNHDRIYPVRVNLILRDGVTELQFRRHCYQLSYNGLKSAMYTKREGYELGYLGYVVDVTSFTWHGGVGELKTIIDRIHSQHFLFLQIYCWRGVPDLNPLLILHAIFNILMRERRRADLLFTPF